MKNDNPRGKRATRRQTIKRAIRLLEFFKRNTDEKHRAGVEELRKTPEISRYVRSPDTFNKTIRDLCESLNCDKNGLLKDESEWRLVCKGFSEYYGSNAPDEPDEKSIASTRGIYYNHAFKEAELDAVITALRASKFVEKEEAERLAEKLKEHLASKHYKAPSNISYTDEFTDTKALAENLRRIQKAINSDSKISLTFNYFNPNGILEPNTSKRHTISPYYIVSSGGAFFLLGLYDNGKLCVYRIDLMSDIHISGKRLPKEGKWAFPQSEKELPEFLVRHAYMSFEDETITVTLKAIKPPSRAKNDLRLTHLHNVFG